MSTVILRITKTLAFLQGSVYQKIIIKGGHVPLTLIIITFIVYNVNTSQLALHFRQLQPFSATSDTVMTYIFMTLRVEILFTLVNP